MSAAEMYDYFTGTVTPDYATTTLSLYARGTVEEVGERNQVIHEADDGSQESITLATTPIFDLVLPYGAMSESDMGTIFDFYWDSAKANCRGNTIKYSHSDGHTYTVRFMTKMNRKVKLGSIHQTEIRFRVLGIAP